MMEALFNECHEQIVTLLYGFETKKAGLARMWSIEFYHKFSTVRFNMVTAIPESSPGCNLHRKQIVRKFRGVLAKQ